MKKIRKKLEFNRENTKIPKIALVGTLVVFFSIALVDYFVSPTEKNIDNRQWVAESHDQMTNLYQLMYQHLNERGLSAEETKVLLEVLAGEDVSAAAKATGLTMKKFNITKNQAILKLGLKSDGELRKYIFYDLRINK